MINRLRNYSNIITKANLESVQESLDLATANIQGLLEMRLTMTEHEALQRYDELLDEIYPDLTIAGYQQTTSCALRLLDEIAYRESFNNWIDSEGIELE